MSYTVEHVMAVPKGPSEMPDLPDILTQRILAEGYVAHGFDAGKSVFKRNWGWASRASFALQGGKWDDAPTILTVSYIPTPKQINVTLKWETTYSPSTKGEIDGYTYWTKQQFESFLKHVNNWLPASG